MTRKHHFLSVKKILRPFAISDKKVHQRCMDDEPNHRYRYRRKERIPYQRKCSDGRFKGMLGTASALQR